MYFMCVSVDYIILMIIGFIIKCCGYFFMILFVYNYMIFILLIIELLIDMCVLSKCGLIKLF